MEAQQASGLGPTCKGEMGPQALVLHKAGSSRHTLPPALDGSAACSR